MNDLMTKSFMSYVDLKKQALKEQDLEMGNGKAVDHKLESFLEEAENVKEEIGSIGEILSHMRKSNEDAKSIHNTEALKSLREEINADIVVVLKRVRNIKSRLEEMDVRASYNKAGTPIYRTKTAVINGLRKNLKDLMMEFQEFRQKMMSEYKEIVQRRYFTVTGVYPDDNVIDKIVSYDNGGERLLQTAIQEHGKGKVMETVVEIQDRHDTAREIEKSLLELHQLFLDMAVMVEVQGDHLDDIQHHVSNACNYVKDGASELNRAKKYQKRSRKWLCFGIIVLLLIIIVVAVPIVESFHHS